MSKSSFLLKYGNAGHITKSLQSGFPCGVDISEASHSNPYWNSTHTQKIIDTGWEGYVIRSAIKHHTTTPEQLHHLAQEGSYSSKMEVLKHPNTHQDSIKLLQQHTDPYMRNSAYQEADKRGIK